MIASADRAYSTIDRSVEFSLHEFGRNSVVSVELIANYKLHLNIKLQTSKEVIIHCIVRIAPFVSCVEVQQRIVTIQVSMLTHV